MRIQTATLLIWIFVLSCVCNAETVVPNVSVIKPTYNGPWEGELIKRNCQVIGPLALSIQQSSNTGKYYLFCQEELNGVEDRYDIIFSDIHLISNGRKKQLSGKVVKFQNGIGWTCDDLADLTEGDILKGVIKAKLAVEKIIVEGVERTTKLKEHGISIEMKKYDGSPRYLCPLGEYCLLKITDENKDRMYYIMAKVENSMNREDAAFVQEVQKKYHEEERYPGESTIFNYKQIKLKTPTIRVNNMWRMPTKQTSFFADFGFDEADESNENNINCHYEREIDHEHSFQIDKLEVGFDCVQDGNDVFPLGIELLKYEPRELEFEITYQGSGLKKLGGTAEPKPQEVRENSIGMKFVWIPAGSFKMGSKLSPSETAEKYRGIEKSFTNEHPQHEVKISKGFWKGQYEVTQLQYKTVMGSNPSNYRFKCPRCDDFLDANIVKEGALKDIAGTHPVETVSWADAMEFCKKLSETENLSYTLPTEAQWEYACRAGTTSPYFFGDDSDKLKDYAWYADNSDEVTHPVGEKLPNPWGLYDMYGNVEELCLDWYNPDYYSKSPQNDPHNDVSIDGKYTLRSIRGGNFVCPAGVCRSATRGFVILEIDPFCEGFRIICNPSSKTNTERTLPLTLKNDSNTFRQDLQN